MRWKKEVVNPLARAEVRAWTRAHISQWGRVCAYSHIAAELEPRNWDPTRLPPYLTIGGLKRSARRNIAVFRIQCAGFVATHAGAWQTDLYGQRRKYYHRYCIWEGCCETDTHKRKPALDDAAHVLLKCPLHHVGRAVMLRTAQAALLRAGLTLADVGSDTAMVQLLLGSMPIT